ncbi:acetyl-coa decarbonylase/synthase complex subunit gamma (acds complex subunit gamma) (acds complex methyltransferase)(corrinoid/iron-sulfur component large subunit) [Treponema primitia ZAS-2]|uniref:Acetyl-coa decarbonylase/synthase complex subunit gamma (Acds complex subunit gamma) (Acds complex methyltransferase)(Corrinoid/iron-sulfur component large subunit) n=1 Tax=Treponema primitia (strain ATCC BAA-887 / DSM 12427 / ZAS-2) TaxID=545694 RepID=F5YMP0_TREPZ|nr:acetyl-CoA decarbonylase/synthase complex subunit gamma [Treponema primitia]AEF86233.1 acetyl-coa decarbonylase/synthase complex subunit gamma (acds complex subunit gamma) (acds complex methyltransferase)(corrinoid/iron-sulfur component large subunit) [Treponema primitia ZAS-2]
MALKGLDIFKLLPKTNCKKCGNPTCMAFAMKVAQGGITIDKCPDISAEALAQLSEASAPPMKALTIGAGDKVYKLGGETVLFRHDKTFVSKSLYAVTVCQDCVDEKLPKIKAVDYERIGERMIVDLINVEFSGDKAKFLDTVKKAQGAARTLILEVSDADAAKAALDLVKAEKPILNGANESNWEAFNKIATEAGVVLGVTGKDLDVIYDTVQKLEGAGNKNLVIDVGSVSIKDAFANAVQIRRAALKDQDRSFGYPSIVNLSKLAKGDDVLQTALASVFTLKYGSIIILSNMSYAQALPLYGLRQNIYTDPQKPMKMEPKIYPVNGADENSICAITVDFALSYFVINGELERSGVPVNLIVSDAGGYSVLTSWAAGKFSAGTISKFFKESGVEGKVKSRNLLIPGKVAVLKGELEENLPGWKILVGPNEAVGVVKYLKDFKG